jgi:serine/threonine protein kinase
MMHAARGLAFLHSAEPARVVHTNISPMSLFMDKRGRVKVGGLLAARCIAQDRQELDADTDYRGRVQYAAPELLMREPFNESADVYSFGVVMWEMATRRRPWFDIRSNESMIVVRKCFHRVELPRPIQEEEQVDGGPLPDGYTELMYSSMAMQPQSRPTIQVVLHELRQMIIAADRASAA